MCKVNNYLYHKGASMLVPILFNLSVNDLFSFIDIASMHNFLDDNTLSVWEETVCKWIDTLESESNITIGFQKNKINPDKFHAIILDRKKSNLTNIQLSNNNQTIRTLTNSFGWQVKL